MATQERDKLANAMAQGAAQFESIREMVEDLRRFEADTGGGMESSVEDAMRAIEESPLSVTVRSGWYAPGAREDAEPAEYEILLCTGGPACRMIGELDGGQPVSARIEVQDWFTPWTTWRGDGWDEKIALEYARQFYFGD